MYTGLDDAYSEASSTSSAGRSERPQQSPGMGISNRSPPDLLPSYARRLTCWKASWDIWILATFFPGLVKEVPVRRAPAHPHVMECCRSRERKTAKFGLSGYVAQLTLLQSLLNLAKSALQRAHLLA